MLSRLMVKCLRPALAGKERKHCNGLASAFPGNFIRQSQSPLRGLFVHTITKKTIINKSDPWRWNGCDPGCSLGLESRSWDWRAAIGGWEEAVAAQAAAGVEEVERVWWATWAGVGGAVGVQRLAWADLSYQIKNQNNFQLAHFNPLMGGTILINHKVLDLVNIVWFVYYFR